MNVSFYTLEGDIIGVSDKEGVIYLISNNYDSILVKKENMCDTLLTNFVKGDTIFIKYPCYELESVDIKGSSIGLKKYWRKVHNDELNKNTGIGDTVLFFSMFHSISFPDYDVKLNLAGRISVSITRSMGQVEIGRVMYYSDTIEGASSVLLNDFFQIFPLYPLTLYIDSYMKLLINNNITKGVGEKNISMNILQKSSKEFVITEDRSEKKYLYDRKNKFKAYISYSTDSVSIGRGGVRIPQCDC